MVDISKYLDNTISELRIKYHDNTIKELDYNDKRDNMDIKCNIIDFKAYNVWEINSNKFNEHVITCTNMTKDHILDLIEKPKTKLITYQNAEYINEEEGTFKIVIDKDMNKSIEYSIELDIDKEFGAFIEYYKDYIKLKVVNGIGEHHYLDNERYIIRNYSDNTECLYYNSHEIKYEFEKRSLSTSNFIQYHHPFRVTDYVSNKQYILEYDEYGIMKSMIDINDPDNNLCKYFIDDSIKSLSKTANSIISIHPNIYDSFNIRSLDYDFIKNKEYMIESYTKLFPLDTSIYNRYLVNNIVVD